MADRNSIAGSRVYGTSTVAHDPCSATRVSAGPSAAAGPPSDAAVKAQAIADLLRNKAIRHIFGRQGEYEVQTIMTTRQAWSYWCDVRWQGKAIRREFRPIAVHHTHEMCQEPIITEEMRVAFAAEAVEVHFARCAAVVEYTLLAALAAHPPARYLRPWVAAVAVIVAALLTGYGLWRTWSVAEVEPQLAGSAGSLASG